MTASFHIPEVRLRVKNLAQSTEFYVQRLGFAALGEEKGEARLAAAPGGEPLLRLQEDRAARPAPASAAGLYHVAFLMPDRGALGAWLRRSADLDVAFEGFSDHGVSEAIYLSDPDGNGLEFYADRPRLDWQYENGRLAMTTKPLDLKSLLGAARPRQAALEEGRWGHIHLRVTDLARSEAFYRKALGLDLTQDSLPGARFLSAEGYHHHVGLNTWGRPREPRPAQALGLVRAAFAAPGMAAAELSDPDGIAIARY